LQHLPLHPLTIEDILHQETREKLESFPALGYYFIVFRALDESYFKYTSTSQPTSPASSSSTLDEKRDDGSEEPSPSAEMTQPRQRGRVDIVEGVGGKEGVEGVGVGAVNMYLIVFGDGILSVRSVSLPAQTDALEKEVCANTLPLRTQFHFEPIDKHLEIVQGKLQQYGNSRNFSSRASSLQSS
jgi:Mg2+ and Co2+ transporter CorA